MKIKFFTKKNCPKCPAAKELAEEIKKEGQLRVEMYDVEEADGLAEAQFYSILATPSIALVQDDDTDIFVWRGEAPQKKEVYEKML